MKQKEPSNWLQTNVLKVSYAHFLLVIALAAQNIAFHSGNLLAPELILNRWVAAAGLLVVTSVVWYLAHFKVGGLTLSKVLVFVIILADIAAISYNVYATRGMASLGVALYAIPIAVSAILYSRSALFMTATVCAAAYTTTSVTYFTVFFNEGYKVQLYGETLFYSAAFFLQAALLWILIRTNKASA